MKKTKSFLILLGILILSLIILNMTKLSSSKTSATNTSEMDTTSSDTVDTLIGFDKNELKEIILISSSETLTFLPTQDAWSIKDAPPMDLDTDAINDTCYNLLHISSFRTIESSDLKEYGLENPTYRIEYKLQDDTTTALTLGLQTPDGSKYYALKNDEPETIYLISASDGDDITSHLEKYRIRTLDTFNPSSFLGLEATGRNIEPIHISALKQANNLKYKLSTPIGTVLDVDIRALEKLVVSFPPFVVDTFVADDVSDLAPYGLDQPILQLTLTSVDPSNPSQTVTMAYAWGNAVDEESIYFTKLNSNSIYTMKKDAIDSLLQQLTLFNLSDKLVCMTPIDSVDSLEVAFENIVHTLAINRESEEPIYLLNEKEVSEDTFKTLYQYIIGIKADSDLTEKNPTLNTPASMNITFNFIDGASKQHTFYSYDNQFYSYKVDDTLSVGCNIKQFNFLKQALIDAGK